MASDLLSSLKVLFAQLQEGERNTADLRKSLTTWARDISDLIRDKVEEEVESSVKKMGFIKKEQYLALEKRVVELEKIVSKRPKTPAKRTRTAKITTVRATKPRGGNVKSSLSPVKKSRKKSITSKSGKGVKK